MRKSPNRSFRNSPWNNKPKGYVLRAAPTKLYPLGRVIDVSQNKEYIFSLLKHYESTGLICHIEDERGEKVS